MRFAIALAALVGLAAASPKPQGVTASLAPSSTPDACASTYDGGARFQIGIVNISSTVAGSKMKRQSETTPDTVPGHALYLTLNDATLKDQDGNTGYIAANGQLQFDPNQPQTGASITTGWSACPNGTLALASSIFYECLSGSFYNLYNKDLGSVCYAVNLQIIGASSPSGAATYGGVEASSTPVATSTEVTYTSTPLTSAVATQVTDGQIQATTAVTPVVTSSASVVSQISDNQVQAPTTAAVSQITDGQIQAPTNGTSLMPFAGNAGSAVFVSGTWVAVMAGAIGLGALLL